MKKVILGITLLAIIAGVSYVKSIRGQNVKNEAFRQGRKQSAAELSQSMGEAESLRTVLGQRELQFADSITARSLRETAQVDSLYELIDNKDKQINSLEGKLQQSEKSLRSGSTTSKKPNPEAARSKKIIEYYKMRYKRLPQDLTDYESKVALNEIREETAAKFSISVTELKVIRAKYALKY